MECAAGPDLVIAIKPSSRADTLRRQASKVEPGWENAARPVLCGRCPVTGIPTEISREHLPTTPTTNLDGRDTSAVGQGVVLRHSRFARPIDPCGLKAEFYTARSSEPSRRWN